LVVGVLALQGSFEKHQEKFSSLGCESKLVRTEEELENLQGLVIPGGESSTLLKLLTAEMREALIQKTSEGLGLLTTCAGTILIAKSVATPQQESLNLIDITVERNSYGRQVDSTVVPNLRSTTKGSTLLKLKENQQLEGIFIRAPKIISTGPKVETLLKYQEDPVLVQEKNILAATFHPELSEQTSTA